MGFKARMSNVILVLVDILLINLGFAIAFWLKFGFSSFEELPEFNFKPYQTLIPWLSVTVVIIFYMFDLYTDWRRKSVYNLIYTIGLAIITFTLVTIALTFWYRGFAFPRSVILIACFCQFILVSMNRYLQWLMSKYLFGRKKVLIVGNEFESGLQVASKILEHSKGWFIVQDFALCAQKDLLLEKIQQVDVVLLSSSIKKQDTAEIISQCAKWDKEVLLVPDLFELFILHSEPQQIDDMLVLSIKPPKLTANQRLVKRIFDLSFSLVMLILVSPVMLLLYIIIPLNSKGPAIYSQERLGRNGKPYQIYKFRSMYTDAEKKTGPVLATERDPRITTIGRFIRATRLDELPQLFNVLKGDMSLIGPRPERKFFIDQFKGTLPDYTYRMSVKPGVTGLAQVLAKYGTTVEDKLRFDLMYVRTYSFALDIKILLQTIRVVLQREQANGVSEKDQEQEKRRILTSIFGHSEIASSKEELI